LPPIVGLDRTLDVASFGKSDALGVYHNVSAKLSLRAIFGVFQRELRSGCAFPASPQARCA
jgi:hypothetical protein